MKMNLRKLAFLVACSCLAQGPVEIRLPLGLAGKPAAFIQHGFLPILERDLTTLSLVDLQGQVRFSGQVSIPGAKVSAIASVAISPNRRDVAIAASTVASDGRLASALILLDVVGKVSSVVRTSPFHVASLIYVSDNRLAALGRSTDDQANELKEHSTIRLFDAKGTSLSEAAPASKMRFNGEHPVMWSRLISRPSGFAVFDRHNLRLVEIGTDGTVGRQIELGKHLGVSAEVTGLAYTTDGRLLISLQADKMPLLAEGLIQGEALSVRSGRWMLPAGTRAANLLGYEADHPIVHTNDGRLWLL